MSRSWTGKNKQYCRQIKESFAIHPIKLYSESRILTLPGNLGITEKKLVKRGISADRMSLVDRDGSILHRLASSSELKGAHFKTGEFEDVVRHLEGQFSFVDMDICGTFHQKHVDTINNLFKRKLLTPSGTLAVNFQKGRECKESQELLLQPKELILCGGIRSNLYYRLCDISSMPRAPLKKEEKLRRIKLEASRIVVIPAIIAGLGLDQFNICVKKLIEYKDQPDNQMAAVNMLQYIFRFERVPKMNQLLKFRINQKIRESIRILSDEYAQAKSCGGSTFVGKMYEKHV